MKYLLFLYLLLNTLSLSAQQSNDTISRKEVDALKKQESELWYVDAPPPNAQKSKAALEDSLRKSYLKQKRSPIAEREEIPRPLNIPEGLLSILKWLFYGVLLAGILFLIFKGNFKFGMGPKNADVNEVVSETTTIESIEQLQKIGYENQIIQAENQGNYRLATRLYYSWTLKKLIDAKFIRFHINKTNMDYCQELSSRTFYEPFRQCTQYYNYVWFGEFNIEQQVYKKVQTSFKALIEQL